MVVTYAPVRDDAEAYWVVRHADDVAFNLVDDKETAFERAEYYETDFGETFRVTHELRSKIPYKRLPPAWEDDWYDRVPNTLTITEVPESIVSTWESIPGNIKLKKQ